MTIYILIETFETYAHTEIRFKYMIKSINTKYHKTKNNSNSLYVQVAVT